MLLSHQIKASTFAPSPRLHRRIAPFPSQILLFSNPPKSLHLTTNPFLHSSVASALSQPQCLGPILNPNDKEKPATKQNDTIKKSFWAAVTLIIGTAVGPGMLGLPSATIRSGPIPSSIAIILSWLYVVSSIVLVAELSFAAMEENEVEEVSFTALATNALGPNFGALVAVIYACLSFSLLIACVSGIGSLLLQQFPLINPILAHALAPCFVGIIIGFFPFEAIDVTNRLLCSLMLFSITALVAIGLSVGRSNLLSSLSHACWRPEAIMPAIPVTVLTLGFHVITPFVCRIVGDSMYDARKAVLLGGAVPLAMVLSWNAVVLGLAGTGNVVFEDPIKLLLSVNSSALPAVQGFAFAALATSLIGYAVSFPKQLSDTVILIAERFDGGSCEVMVSPNCTNQDGRVGSAVYSRGLAGTSGQASFSGGKTEIFSTASEQDTVLSSSDGKPDGPGWKSILVTWLVLIVPIFIASFFQAAFSKALEFAGVYANCFLFGVLPPAMAWIHRSRQKYREDLLPGGSISLSILFGIALILGFWH